MENSLERKSNPELLFRKILIARYEYERATKGERNGVEHFLQYLIDHNLIEPITIQRYNILYAFQTIYEEQNFHKTNTVKELARQFGLSERQVWTVLKTHTQRFKSKK